MKLIHVFKKASKERDRKFQDLPEAECLLPHWVFLPQFLQKEFPLADRSAAYAAYETQSWEVFQEKT